MRIAWGLTCCLLSLLLVSSAVAQTTVPAIPAAPAVPAAPAGAAGVIGQLCGCCKSLKACFCASPLGGLLGNALRPLSALSGGLVPGGCCPPIGAGAAGAAGTANQIQSDQAAAKQRMLAVRFLGTVDCHWYPEAEAGLVQALRADRSECVRFEAAKALARGCCCTKTTIEALTICVAGSEKDGNPSENSLRVQLMALEALQHCVTSYKADPGKELPRPEQPAGANGELAQAGPVENLPQIHLSGYYAKVKNASRDDVIANAKKVVASVRSREIAVPEQARGGRRSVYEIWQRTQ